MCVVGGNFKIWFHMCVGGGGGGGKNDIVARDISPRLNNTS